MNSMNLVVPVLVVMAGIAVDQTKPNVAVSDQRSAISRTEPGKAGSDETNPTPLSAQLPRSEGTPFHPPCPEGAAVCSQGRKPLENIALSASWSPEGATEPAPSAPTISENQTNPPPTGSVATAPNQTNPPLPSRPSTDSSLSSFTALDIFIDPLGSPLAAYQVELLADPTQVAIVGIEGGSHPAFREPPYYDPAALMNHRVIIAAFNTSKNLPTTRTRVATIHVRITGDAKPSHQARLQTAGDPEGKTLSPAVTVEERKPTATSPGTAGTRESNDTRTPTTQQGAKE